MDNKQHFSILKWNAKIAQLIQVMLGKEKGKKKEQRLDGANRKHIQQDGGL